MSHPSNPGATKTGKQPQFLVGADLIVGTARVAGQGVLVADGRIASIHPATSAPAAMRVGLPRGSVLAPGFIDVQVNGGGGLLFNDAPTMEGALTIAAAHRRLGTTAILPTLITSARPAMADAAVAVAAAVRQPGSGVIGLHYEGPFLSPLRPGVHRRDLIRLPDGDDLAWLEALPARGFGPVVLTVAPEMVGPATVSRLAAAGLVLSAGHSEASFGCMQECASMLRGITHLFNAMPAPAARAPGLVTAALLGNAVCGIIVDGIHVQLPMLQLMLAVKPASQIMLVSDAMSVAGTSLTQFDLMGRTIERRDGKLVTADGTLAGADLSLAQAVRNAVTWLGVDLAVAVSMASAVPAAFLDVSGERGSIAPGLQADFTLLSPALDVLGTWVAGDWQGQAGVLAAGVLEGGV